MNSLVVYFSITGNTKKIAQAIHTGMKKASQPGDKVDIARLRDVDSPDLANYDLIGLGGPLMWIKEPPNVTDFINSTLKMWMVSTALLFVLMVLCLHSISLEWCWQWSNAV